MVQGRSEPGRAERLQRVRCAMVERGKGWKGANPVGSRHGVYRTILHRSCNDNPPESGKTTLGASVNPPLASVYSKGKGSVSPANCPGCIAIRVDDPPARMVRVVASNRDRSATETRTRARSKRSGPQGANRKPPGIRAGLLQFGLSCPVSRGERRAPVQGSGGVGFRGHTSVQDSRSAAGRTRSGKSLASSPANP